MHQSETISNLLTHPSPCLPICPSHGTFCLHLTTLMSLFQCMGHGCSSPDRLGSTSVAEGRAWQGAALKTTVERTCMGLSVSSARHCRSALVAGPAVRPCLGGMRDDRRGARPCGAPVIAPQTCRRSTRLGPNHDAAVRIGGEAPGRRAHSLRRLCRPCLFPGHRHLGSSSAACPANCGRRRNWSFDFFSGQRLMRLDGERHLPAAVLSSRAATMR